MQCESWRGAPCSVSVGPQWARGWGCPMQCECGPVVGTGGCPRHLAIANPHFWAECDAGGREGSFAGAAAAPGGAAGEPAGPCPRAAAAEPAGAGAQQPPAGGWWPGCPSLPMYCPLLLLLDRPVAFFYPSSQPAAPPLPQSHLSLSSDPSHHFAPSSLPLSPPTCCQPPHLHPCRPALSLSQPSPPQGAISPILPCAPSGQPGPASLCRLSPAHHQPLAGACTACCAPSPLPPPQLSHCLGPYRLPLAPRLSLDFQPEVPPQQPLLPSSILGREVCAGDSGPGAAPEAGGAGGGGSGGTAVPGGDPRAAAGPASGPRGPGTAAAAAGGRARGTAGAAPRPQGQHAGTGAGPPGAAGPVSITKCPAPPLAPPICQRRLPSAGLTPHQEAPPPPLCDAPATAMPSGVAVLPTLLGWAPRGAHLLGVVGTWHGILPNGFPWGT